MIDLLFFMLGSIIASFLSVVMYRRNKGLNYIKDRSRCEYCNKIIPIYLNIPIISYILLRGTTNCCNKKIRVSIFINEIVGGLLLFVLYKRYDLNLLFLIRSIEFFIIFLIFITDINEQNIYLKDLSLLFVMDIMYKIYNKNLTVKSFIAGIILFTIFYIIYKFTKSIGEGDIILAFVIGFISNNIINSLLIFRNSFLIASVVSIILICLKRKTRKDYIAFAPYLILALIINTYFRW